MSGGLPQFAGGADAKSSPEIKAIMTKLAKGPTSLNSMIGAELKADEPAWETIQGQTKEYATLAAEMKDYSPPRGSDESWQTQASGFADAAAKLDEAAQAKDKDAASAAHQQLSQSCMACHREHRGMMPGTMGGPPGGFPGGPPGGFPGAPAGGPPGSGLPANPPNPKPETPVEQPATPDDDSRP